MSDVPTTIEDYLDELAEALLLPPGRARRVMRETEDHLHDATAALIEDGLDEAEAQRTAIQRFGAPAKIAASFAPDSVAWVPLVRAAAGPLISVTIVGLLAVGLSGLIALALSGVFGRDFVAGDASGVTYTPARCADYLEYEPGAKDCSDAAIRHHFGEIIDYRGFAGVIGLFGLGGVYVFGRRRGRHSRLPAAFAPTVGASIFGVAALGLLFMSGGSSGQMGASLSGAMVSAGVAAVYALRLTRLLTPAQS